MPSSVELDAKFSRCGHPTEPDDIENVECKFMSRLKANQAD